MNPLDIVQHFRINGQIKSYEAIRSGHINTSYRLFNLDPNSDYLLQKINTTIFKDVDSLMSNIAMVANHCNSLQPDITLTLISTIQDNLCFKDSENNYWRLYKWMNEYESFDTPNTIAHIFRGGRGFGKFSKLLSTLNSQKINQTLPGFHDLKYRYQQLLNSTIQQDITNEINLWLAKSKGLYEILSPIRDAISKKKIPKRITHNDTKFNNILLHKTQEIECVVDLETVMPGYILYDYGDGIRTSATVCPEDEKVLEKIKIDKSRVEAFKEGFLSEANDIMYNTEKTLLPLAGPLLAYLMGIRFLTDHMMGDKYYNIEYPGHNFIRAKSQLTLCQRLLDYENV